jgi:RNA polymerase sigma-70 factor (ECF subfamily)
MEASPGHPDSDERLVARFQGGDESAFDELVVRHRRAVYALARRLTGGHAEADDLSQEAFLRAYRGLRRFRGEAGFGTWMTRIVVNLALSARRTARRELPFEAAGAEGPSGGPGGGPGGPADATLRRQVRRAVGRLAPRQMQVVMLKVYQGMTFREIAGAAGISVGTAKATFFQAVASLRGRLRQPAAAAPGRERP